MKKLILLLSVITTSSIAQTNFWEHTNGPPDGNVICLAINNGDIFAGTSDTSRGIFRSTDNGDNWSEINTGLTNNVIFDLSVNSSGDIFAGTGGGVFRSTDNGDDWSEINSGLTNTTVFALTINNSDDIFAGTFSGNGGVFRSSNNGSTWSPVGLIGVFIYGLAINDNGDIFAGTFAGVWRSSDNGNTWSQKIIGLTNMDVLDFAFNSSGDIFAGTNGGMFRSSNNGDNWTAINNGLTSTDAWSCASNSRDDIFAGTLSGGVFHSDDNGDSWSAINSGLTNTAVRALAINSSDQIFVGSGDGVSKSTAISEPKGDIFVVTNTNDSGTGSLRQTILNANNIAGTDTIVFDIPGAGPHTIQPNSALPSITDPVVIDGYTQPGASPNTNPITQSSNAVLMIELDGANAGAGVNGLIIVAGNSTVRGLVINRFVQGGGRTGEGIHLSTNGGNAIEGNFLGTDITGTVALGGSGVRILSGSGNTIGGTAPAARNIISGNGYGIVMDSNASGNLVQGNFIGIDATGTVALGNQLDGIAVAGDDNTIGGTTLDARNVISGNVRRGVHLSFRSKNLVQGNFIGTDLTGTIALGNGWGGVAIFRSANNTIGGTTANAGNLISGNPGAGIDIDDAEGNLIQGNFIGTDVTGLAALGNGRGIYIEEAPDNQIGGTEAGAGNVISANSIGIYIVNSQASGNVIQGNFIGTAADGTSPLGNDFDGVLLTRGGGGVGASDNLVGGDSIEAGNIIAFNGRVGVFVQQGSINNAILSNSIFSNGNLGIDLVDAFGFTPNDVGDGDSGPNNLQNFPEITAVGFNDNADLGFLYRVDSEPSNSTYPLTIQFFAADASGEGMRLLGDDVYTQVDFSTGTKSVNLGNAMALGISIGDRVVATATDSSGNTSEFSPINIVGVIEGVAIVVSADTLDYGPVFLGASSTRTLIITNLGTEQLTVSDISLDNSNYNLDISSFNLNSGESQGVLVTFTPSTPGEFLGTLTITNSDPNKPIMTVALRGMGVLGSPTRLTARAAEDSVSLSWAGKAIEESEPNNTFEIADTLNISQVATGTINPAQDIDFWTFQGTMGQNVTIDVDAQVNGSTLDAVIGLFINEDLDGDGSPDVVVVNDDFGGSFDSRIEINLPKTQTYFIGIVDFSGDGGPNYFYDISLASTSGMLALLSTTSHTPLSRVLHKRGNAKVSGLKSRQMESELSIKLVELPVLKAVASNKVALASSESADLLGYNIYRSNSSPVQVTDGNRIGDVPATTFFFTDMDVQIGTIYYYVVTAFYDQGESEPSNEVSAEPQKKLWEQTGLTNKSVLPLVVSSNDQLFAGVYGDASLGFPGEGMIRSVDNGDTWTQINNGLLNLNIFALAVNSNQHLFAGTDTSGVFRSTDNGDSWSALNTGLPNENDFFSEIRSLAINTNDHIFAATSAGIFRSSDNGNKWVRTGFPSDPGNIAVNSSGHLFAGTQLDGIFRSTDNGDNWQQINTGLPDRTISAIGIDPSDNIFIMTNAGVFLSNNGGDSWTDVTNGIMHFIIAFAFNSSGHIFAGTIDFFGKGGGVYRSTDGGESWTQINAGLTSLNILSLAVNSQDQIFAGTLERGVFRLLEIATSVEDLTGAIPISFVLEQNYPNPFNPTTIIRYQLSEFTHVELTIYNQLGQRIKTLVNERQLAGDYQSEWNGRNEMGQQVSSGVYFYRLRAESFSETQKMILMR